LLTVEAKLHQALGDHAYITFSADNCLEVMAPGVSKGHALQLVLDELAIDTADCLAFGDGQNDIELLQTVGHPRVMANAHPAWHRSCRRRKPWPAMHSPAWPCICASCLPCSRRALFRTQ
jgi:hydroxymethylpyrimidine pyrophosphatase-like HAD family hydrolase